MGGGVVVVTGDSCCSYVAALIAEEENVAPRVAVVRVLPNGGAKLGIKVAADALVDVEGDGVERLDRVLDARRAADVQLGRNHATGAGRHEVRDVVDVVAELVRHVVRGREAHDRERRIGARRAEAPVVRALATAEDRFERLYW